MISKPTPPANYGDLSSPRAVKRDNNYRAKRALYILQTYERDFEGPHEGVDTSLVDLLADLMHWGSAKRHHSAYDKFEGALDRARGHFAAEEAGIL